MGFKPLTYKNAPGEEPHITPEDDAAIYESIVGTDGVFTVGERFKATVISNNKVRIGNGVLNVGGHMGRTTYGDYVDVTIENGVSEQNRNDLIIARFVIGDTDTYELDVKKGVSGKEAVDPELVQEDLYNGGKTREYPLYRVKIEGLSIVKVEQMFEIRPTIPMLNKYLFDILRNSILKPIEKSFIMPYQNRCKITSEAVYASNIEVDFKIDLTMQYTINVANEQIVAVITDDRYKPKTIKQFPIIEYAYASLSTLLVYPNGNISIYIPKGGAIQNGFANNQQLSFRGSYPI
ncbi:MAG: hypothetical protein E6686_08510 [Lachnospiraceae bacterium]|nr:hypothetical protein [Lachnospiraceae bacterium]